MAAEDLVELAQPGAHRAQGPEVKRGERVDQRVVVEERQRRQVVGAAQQFLVRQDPAPGQLQGAARPPRGAGRRTGRDRRPDRRAQAPQRSGERAGAGGPLRTGHHDHPRPGVETRQELGRHDRRRRLGLRGVPDDDHGRLARDHPLGGVREVADGLGGDRRVGGEQVDEAVAAPPHLTRRVPARLRVPGGGRGRHLVQVQEDRLTEGPGAGRSPHRRRRPGAGPPTRRRWANGSAGAPTCTNRPPFTGCSTSGARAPR